MKKYLRLVLFFVFVLICTNIFSNQVSASSTTNITGGGASGSTITSINVNGRIGSSSPASFDVSVSCTNCQDNGSWDCYHPSAAADGIQNVGIDRAEVTLQNSDSSYDYYSVVIYPSDYSTSTNECPYDNSSNGGPGYHKCYIGHQSIKGTVKVPKKSSDPDPTPTPTPTPTPEPTCTPNPVTTSTSSTTSYTRDYYLDATYLRYGTGATITCAAPLFQGPFSVTTYITTTTYTTDDGCGNSSSYDVVSVSTTPPEQAYINPPSFICGGEYRYHHAYPGTGPIVMDGDKTVDLYYEQIHTLTVTPRRIVGDSQVCGKGAWTRTYYDSDSRSSVGQNADGVISCYTGIYDLYNFKNLNNATTSGSTTYPYSTFYDSSDIAVYRRRNTLTLKHINYYDRNGPLITTDQSTTVHDYENATISPVANNFNYGGYEYELYGYADGRNSTVVPSKNTTYTAYSLTSDITRWALYKKVLYLTVIPVDRNGNRLANNLVQRVLEGDSASIKTYTTIGNYTFTGFGTDYRNPGFPSSYIYSVNPMRNHVNIYAVYETSDSLTSACPPTNGAMVQSYVRNLRFDGAWNRETTYARPGDQISYCTGYNNKYPYWNFMYPDYDYLVNYGSYYNPNRAYPIGYRGAASLNSQLYSSYSVTSNRENPLQYYENKQLSFVQNRANQQENFKSTKRATIKNYPANASEASIAFNKNDVGLASGVYEQGHINSISSNTSTSYVHDAVSNVASGKVISSLPRSKLDFNTARAYFPYNFQNNSTIRDNGPNFYVDAGGTTDLSIDLHVNPKENSATRSWGNDKYATVDKGDIYYRVEVTTRATPTAAPELTKVSTAQVYSTNGNKPINADHKKGGDSANTQLKVNVPDVNPGTYVCFRSSIWPKDSGADTNVDKPNGGYDKNTINSSEAGWSAWGPQVCYKAKGVPTIQAWGGNVIANGQIATSFATKRHVYGVNEYQVTGGYGDTHIFGSWGELGVIANRNTQFMASGTALGYPNGLVRSASMSENDTYERFVPLTFANYDPNLPTTTKVIFGDLNKTYSSEEQTFDKSMLVNKYIYDTGVNYNNSTLTLNGDITASYMGTDYYHADNNVYYYHANPNLQINSSEIAKNATQVIHVNGDIRISGNITYLNTYTRLENIPKLIIYADGGAIKIDYNVSQVDAILIADTVVTCSEESGCKIPAEDEVVTNPANSAMPLTINGTIIAKQVIPNRTYGAGRGVGQYNDGSVNSITPAEVINYDPSLYRWEQYSANRNESKITPDATLITTYLKEVAPRY